MPPLPLCTALFSATSPALAHVVPASEPLERALEAWCAQGRAAWPSVAVAATSVVAFVGRHLDGAMVSEPGQPRYGWLDGVRAADVHLATACSVGNRAALALFEQQFGKEVDIALARMRVTGAKLADVKQLVLQRLFVGEAGRPGKIIEYGGRGDLRRWVRSVAVRTCLNELRRHKRELVTEDHVLAQAAVVSSDDPSLAYMKQTYGSEFRTAFAMALAQLDARAQTLLRYHHVDSLTIDEIGAVYRVHRVTAFRWLEKARADLIAGTLAEMRARLRLSPDELESVLRIIQSSVHVSLVRQLGGPGDRVENDDETPLEDVEELASHDGQEEL